MKRKTYPEVFNETKVEGGKRIDVRSNLDFCVLCYLKALFLQRSTF